MSCKKSIVVTVRGKDMGHDEIIDTISVSLFDEPDGDNHNAVTYCNNINNPELNSEKFVYARIISENVPYSLKEFVQLKFERILKLDDRAIQKVLRELDSMEIARALKGTDTQIREKIFRNMSAGASKMLKEDMEYMGSIRKLDVIEAQEKFLSIVEQLIDIGEINNYSEGEYVE